MPAESLVAKVLQHTLIRNAIADTVEALIHGGAAKSSAASIVSDFAAKVLERALVERVWSPQTESRNWKTVWADASLALFMKAGGAELMHDYAAELSKVGYRDEDAYDLLVRLATALSGVGQLIKCGVNPKLLFY